MLILLGATLSVPVLAWTGGASYLRRRAQRAAHATRSAAPATLSADR